MGWERADGEAHGRGRTWGWEKGGVTAEQGKESTASWVETPWVGAGEAKEQGKGARSRGKRVCEKGSKGVTDGETLACRGTDGWSKREERGLG